MSRYSDMILATAGLVSYWRLGESSGSAADSKGANTGTCTNVTYSAAGGIAGDANTAFTFNGVDAKVNCGNTASLQLTTVSVEAWFKVSGAISQDGVVGKDGAYSILIASNNLAFYDWGSSTMRNSGVAVNDNVYHHAVVTTVSGGSNQSLIYLDGALVMTTTRTDTSQTSPVIIGDFNASPTSPFHGTIDEVAIYSSILAPATIKQHYNGGLGRFGDTRKYSVFQLRPRSASS